MEHRLILGGAQYLPYARSRVKALRAAGKQFAREEAVFADGQVTVRIAGEHEYIILSGAGLQLSMDSGLIDLKHVEAGSPLRFAAGTREETNSTTAYHAPYVPGTGRWRAWRLTDPALVPNGQMAGTVTFTPFTGHLRPDGSAPSFNPKRQAVTPATDPPTWEDDPADSTLWAKKTMVSKCPASVFTGRCRLYVQAMYGRPLYSYGAESSTTPITTGNAKPSLASTNPPSLSLPAYHRSSDEVTYAPVVINTSAGVRFDPVTGKHWLMIVNGEHLDVYPLISSSEGERARKYLAGAKVTRTDPLSAADIEKLEAYVLAYCLPDVKNKFAVHIGTETPGYSMGYGWHWNWSGTAADIVTALTFSQGVVSGIEYSAMISTHRRITVAVTDDGTWVANKTVIEGPTQWAVHRAYWCVAEPLWSDMSMIKSTPRNSLPFACDAPIYVFYKRDELQTLRVSVADIPEAPQERVSTYGYADSGYGALIVRMTSGMLDGSCEDKEARSQYFQATFRCGDTVYSGLDMPWTRTSAMDVLTKNSFTEGVHGFDNTFLGTHVFTEGYDIPWGEGYQVYTIPNCLVENDGAPQVYSTLLTFSRESSASSTATLIVPFNDAEAVFMEGTRYLTTTDTGITEVEYVSGGLGTQASRWTVVGFDPITGNIYEWQQAYIKWIIGGPGGALSTTNPPDLTTDTTTEVGRELVCRAGSVTATMGDLSSYHDNTLDSATVSYGAVSGSSADLPVVLSPTHIDPVGFTGDVPSYAALVGWV